MARVAIVYHSATGTNQATAEEVAEGAKAAGAELRVRLVAETLPPEVVAKNPAWKAFVEKNQNTPKASLDDLDCADAVVFGTPTQFGNMAAQLKGFIDSAGGRWFQGKLANKVYAGFTSAQNVHGGNESTLLALYNSIHHFGGILATPGYTDPIVFASGGNPCAVSVATGPDGKGPTDVRAGSMPATWASVWPSWLPSLPDERGWATSRESAGRGTAAEVVGQLKPCVSGDAQHVDVKME